eukprot:TRINITY_DN1320_c0_g1_i3.p1 TRINITY_DN1320_c0_g1~~TRINITY_DN1320_c0_g1_i3.p1  ORF type:complete len:984 (+),score=210.20 TRINITY_DN1320_c0_g1_i3:44-2953(+)
MEKVVLQRVSKKDPDLKIIDLSRKDLTGEYIRKLCELLSWNVNVKTLFLSENPLSSEGIFHIADLIGGPSTCLRELYLDDTRLCDSQMIKLSESLAINCKLVILDLSANQIRTGGAESLGLALSKNKTLKSLNLFQNQLGSKGTILFARGLRENTTLEQLWLGGNGIDSAGADALATCLVSDNSLILLDLSGNKIPDDGVQSLLRALKSSTSTSLKELRIDSNPTTGASSTEEIKSILGSHQPKPAEPARIITKKIRIPPRRAPAMAQTQTTEIYLKKVDAKISSRIAEDDPFVRKLILSGCKISWVELQMLFKSVTRNTRLESLILSDNVLGDAGIIFMGNAAASLSGLRELHLDGNSIGDAGIMKFLQIISRKTSLKTLDLSANQISTKGGEAIGRFLTFSHSLESLNLYQNDIGPDGARGIAEGLKVNKGMKELWLGDNGIGSTGAAYLADCLIHNTTLCLLSLPRNMIDDDGAAVLEKCLQHNNTLRELNLKSNPIWNKKLLSRIVSHCEIVSMESSIVPIRPSLSEAMMPLMPGKQVDDPSQDYISLNVRYENDICEPCVVSVHEWQTANDLRSLLPTTSKAFAIRYSGLYLRDNEQLHINPTVGAQRTVFLEHFPDYYHSDYIRFVVKNLSGEIIDFEAYLEENIEVMKQRLSRISGMPIESIDSILYGVDVIWKRGSVMTSPIKEGVHALMIVDHFESDACISRMEKTIDVDVRFRNGTKIRLHVDPDDTFSVFIRRIKEMDDFKPLESGLHMMKFRGVIPSMENTLRELGLDDGSTLDLPQDYVFVDTEDKRRSITVVVKFLDCSAMFLSVNRNFTFGDVYDILLTIPGMESVHVGKMSFGRSMTNGKRHLWEAGLQHGDVLIIPEFLPDHIALPNMFFHYDMCVDIEAEGILQERVFVHHSDPVSMVRWIVQSVPEFRGASSFNIMYNGNRVNPSLSFEKAGIHDESVLFIPSMDHHRLR